MSITLDRARLLGLIGGRSHPSAERYSFQGVEFDSRRIKGGELFFALAGEKTHGHEFAAAAYRQGAALLVVEDRSRFAELLEPERLIEVDDSLAAFSRLAAWWRGRLDLPLGAVTGSVGKTTVKEMAAKLLLQCGRGWYSLKSFNNQTGVPYTLCGLSPQHSWAVVEMGMNHPGELRHLSTLAAPQVALITRIGAAHQQAFATVADIAAAKCEIMEGLRPNGLLLLNADDPVLLAAVAKKDPDQRIARAYFGSSAQAQVRVHGIAEKGLAGISFELDLYGEESCRVQMRLLGRHNAYNAAAAVLLARSLRPELSVAQIKAALEAFCPPEMRLVRYHTKRGRHVIDDAYNANPLSMQAFLGIAGELKRQGLSIGLILGDMRELGATAEQHHREIADQAAALQPVFIAAVGEFARIYCEAAQQSGLPAYQAASPEAAGHIATKYQCQVVLVKASRALGLERAVHTILEVEGEMPPLPEEKL